MAQQTATPLVIARNLSVTIGGKHVVDGANFHIDPGEILCFVGESGSGKTLSALALMGLLPDVATVTADDMTFDGQNLVNLNEAAFRKLRGAQIGMIFQEPMTSLNPVMPVGRQVAEVFEVHTNLSAKQIHARVIDLFKRVKLPEPERRFSAYPFQLSGGQRQRVMIAMALAMNPKLLIADEPTTALDVTVQGGILSLIRELRDELGMAVLFVTHDFGVVRQMADRVVVMQHGRIVEQGTTKNLMENPQEAYTKQLLAAMPHMNRTAAAQPDEPKDQPAFLNVTDLNKTFMVKKGGFFGKREPFHALKNVSFAMNKGETVGIVGESGCGKSTLARCLVRLYAPDAGKVVFQGEDVSAIDGRALRAMRRDMQMVFQDPFSSLNPRMKVGETVGEGVRAHNLMPAKERRDYVRQLLTDCGLPADTYDRYPHQFSGGQRQRVGMARALALRPALIIADEPVSALDVSVQKQILELMQSLKDKYNLSYLFISHDLRVVSQICNRVLVMRDGEIVEQGPTAQVFTNPAHAYTRSLLEAIPDGT